MNKLALHKMLLNVLDKCTPETQVYHDLREVIVCVEAVIESEGKPLSGEYVEEISRRGQHLCQLGHGRPHVNN